MSTMSTDPATPLNGDKGSPEPQAPNRRLRWKWDWRLVSVLALAALSVPFWRALTANAEPKLTEPMHGGLQPVAVAKVTREDLSEQLQCNAELRPYQEIDLHAKVAGFLQSIDVDIGDRVKEKQLLATIEIPELEDDIAAAQANLKRSEEEVSRAEAAYEEAHQVYTRLDGVIKTAPNLIAPQDLDAAQAKERTTSSALAATKAQVEVARAGLNKLHTMLGYSQISAPFPGVITKRYADPGALIQAGTSSSTQTLPLVRLSQNDRLRLSIPISVSYVARIHVGDPVEIHVETLNKNLAGTIARSTRKVETATRTMVVEVDVPNPDLQLLPGMYASVALQLAHRDKTLVVPVEAVSRKETCTVLVVNRDNQLEERTVTLGLETPHKVEVLSGLKENDLVMIGSRAQVKTGQSVEPKLMAANTAQ